MVLFLKRLVFLFELEELVFKGMGMLGGEGGLVVGWRGHELGRLLKRQVFTYISLVV